MAEKDFLELSRKVKDAVKNMLEKKFAGIVGITPAEGKWLVNVEVIERDAVPDTQSLIGIYQFTFDKTHNLLDYKRTQIKRKGDLVHQKIDE